MQIEQRVDNAVIVRNIVRHRIQSVARSPLLLKRLKLLHETECALGISPRKLSECPRQLNVATPHPMGRMIPIHVVRDLAEDLEDVAIFGLGHRGSFHGRPYPTTLDLAYRAVEAVAQRALFGGHQFAVLGSQSFDADSAKKILLCRANEHW